MKPSFHAPLTVDLSIDFSTGWSCARKRVAMELSCLVFAHQSDDSGYDVTSDVVNSVDM
jgi:hypothetical protein